jgi:hypothetical protein
MNGTNSCRKKSSYSVFGIDVEGVGAVRRGDQKISHLVLPAQILQ